MANDNDPRSNYRSRSNRAFRDVSVDQRQSNRNEANSQGYHLNNQTVNRDPTDAFTSYSYPTRVNDSQHATHTEVGAHSHGLPSHNHHVQGQRVRSHPGNGYPSTGSSAQNYPETRSPGHFVTTFAVGGPAANALPGVRHSVDNHLARGQTITGYRVDGASSDNQDVNGAFSNSTHAAFRHPTSSDTSSGYTNSRTESRGINANRYAASALHTAPPMSSATIETTNTRTYTRNASAANGYSQHAARNSSRSSSLEVHTGDTTDDEVDFE